MMKNLKCECCGASLKINPYNPYFDDYFCDYCGSKYKANNEGVIRIETYQNPVRTLIAKKNMCLMMLLKLLEKKKLLSILLKI